jgi:voltage-gated potassium channel
MEEAKVLESERLELLERIEAWLEIPMVILGFAWLGLLIAEFVWGVSTLFEGLGTIIWIVFILDFTLKLTLAPHKRRYLRHNLLTLVALFIPALRIFRIARAVRVLRLARTARSLRLVRVVTSLNRGMRALTATMGRRGFGYVVLLTVIVTFAGAAGMYAFEQDGAVGGLNNYATALWWTSMIMLTLGSDYWPQSAEGRVLCILLSLYAFGIFGYVTATLASFFIGRDAEGEGTELAGARELGLLREEIALLREELRARTAPDE